MQDAVYFAQDSSRIIHMFQHALADHNLKLLVLQVHIGGGCLHKRDLRTSEVGGYPLSGSHRFLVNIHPNTSLGAGESEGEQNRALIAADIHDCAGDTS